jgi:hypothetical protein
MRLVSFTDTQHRLFLPAEIRDAAKERWVTQQQAQKRRSIDDAPFPRMVDFWFMSIGLAVHRDLAPVEKISGVMFVQIGPNKQDLQKFPEFWTRTLTLLAVNEWGYDDPRCIDPARVIDLANRYAEVGSPVLLGALESQMDDMSSARLYVLSDVLIEETEPTRQSLGSKVF